MGVDDFNEVEDPDANEADLGDGDVVELPGRYAYTDMGNADRFADRYGDRVRYCSPWSKWLCWDGRRWNQDDIVQVEMHAKDSVRMIVEQAKRLPEGKGRDALLKHGIRSQHSSRIRAVLELGRSHPGIPIRPQELDDDRNLLNVMNGTLDLASLELRPHNKLDLLTKLAPVTYDPEAECYRWEQFLREVFLDDAQLIEYVQRAVGYSLTGDVSAQVFFLLHGGGENGKTTFLETIRHLMGDYAQNAAPKTFIQRRGDGIPNDIARLMGARFVTAIETGKNRRLDETLVKQVTGGDQITARFLRAEFFEFEPHFKVWFATNHKPSIEGTDHAIWRRIRLIPFGATFTKENREDGLVDTLIGELPGILNWAVSGLQRFRWGSTLDEAPEAVTEATEAYRTEEDVIGQFLGDCCTVDPMARARSTELYEAYVKWCTEGGERAETKNKFGRMLQERGLDSVKSNATHWRLGVELLGPLEQEV